MIYLCVLLQHEKEKLMDMPQFLIIGKAASILRVSRVTIRWKLSSGKIRAARLRKQVLISTV
jgi:excisionase family DNA binding protein